MSRRQATLNIPTVLVDRMERAIALGWTGAYSRDEFARRCIEERLEEIERLQLDLGQMRSDLSLRKPESSR